MKTYPNVKLHFDLIERIAQEKDTEIKKELCHQDIALFPAFCRDSIRMADEAAEESMQMGHLIGEKYPLEYYKNRVAYMYRMPRYPSFKTLAIIYEKEKEYDKAIKICERAISVGCVDDGTKGGMVERLRKLKTKKEAL